MLVARAEEVRTVQEIQEIRRAFSDWSSPKGLRTDILPWRLWEKAKRLHWDPADIDFSADAADFARLDDEQRSAVAGLARGFMVGEEAVTLDILPLVMAMADEGRPEETMYLTTFAYEEAKHVDFFRRFFDAVGFDLVAWDTNLREALRAEGFDVPSADRPRDALFESELPRVMRRLLTDRSPQAFLDAAVTYNQFVEGCLAIAGYRLWGRIFEELGVLPGLREGLALVQRDERRHIAYGTYLCRRLIAAHPELFDFARERMYALRDYYFRTQFLDPRVVERDGAGYGGAGLRPFRDQVLSQVERRIAVMERARSLSVEEAERGTGAEEAEVELEQA